MAQFWFCFANYVYRSISLISYNTALSFLGHTLLMFYVLVTSDVNFGQVSIILKQRPLSPVCRCVVKSRQLMIFLFFKTFISFTGVFIVIPICPILSTHIRLGMQNLILTIITIDVINISYFGMVNIASATLHRYFYWSRGTIFKRKYGKSLSNYMLLMALYQKMGVLRM